MRLPSLLYATSDGKIHEHKSLKLAYRAGYEIYPATTDELIPLPPGSELFMLPERYPVGYNPHKKCLETLTHVNGKEVFAVSAFISPAYTQTGLTAYIESKPNLKPLPLFAYTAVGYMHDRFWVMAFRSDPDKRQDYKGFNKKLILRNAKRTLGLYPHNRLIKHLAHCCMVYGCAAAKNFFLGRYEAPLPTSPSCNARCLGCISFQDENGPPKCHDRITFVPDPEEILEVALLHASCEKRPIVSFGQGCEGEPLLQARTLKNAISLIKSYAKHITVNLNSNASKPDSLESLISVGLDSLRISMNSPIKEYYLKYFNPKGYSFEDVLKSWELMKSHKKFVSLNLFILPGFTDIKNSIDTLSDFIEKFKLDLIQLRNFNIDPLWYLKRIDFKPKDQPIGIIKMKELLEKRFPFIKFGYFNPYVINL